jgi:hypothetical protein
VFRNQAPQTRQTLASIIEEGCTRLLQYSPFAHLFAVAPRSCHLTQLSLQASACYRSVRDLDAEDHTMAVMRRIFLLWLLPVVLAVPAPVPAPTQPVAAVVQQRQPQTTPAANLEQRSPDFADSVGSYVNSVLSGIGSGVSSFVASGVPQWEVGLPTGTAVQQSVGASDSDLSAKPTQVLNVP